MSEIEKNDITSKLESTISNAMVTTDVENRIMKLSNFSKKLEKVSPALKDEFLEIIDDVISAGNIDKIIAEDVHVKKKY